MGYFTLVTVNHDNLHRDLKDPDFTEKFGLMVTGNHHIGVSPKQYDYRKPESLDLLYMNHRDACPLMFLTHGFKLEVLRTANQPGPGDTTGEAEMVKALKALGYVVYKK